MRNRGYRFIIRDLGIGQARCALCVNSTWINQLLRDQGIEPRDFRRVTWEDLYEIQTSERMRSVIEELRPKNFWQMCDAVAMPYAKYGTLGKGRVYQAAWYRKYPVLVVEDVYEIMLDEGYSQQEALEVMDCVAEHNGMTDRRELRDLLELYDVSPTLSRVLLECRCLPMREQMIRVLVDQLRQIPWLAPAKEYPEKRETGSVAMQSADVRARQGVAHRA